MKQNLVDESTSFILKVAPVTDDEGEWISVEEAVGWRMRQFSSNFPPVNTDYRKYKSVSKMMSQLAFAGLCCLRTQKLDSLPKNGMIRNICKDTRAVYVNDNTALGNYRVRRGYQRYGAAAYFDADCHLIGVYSCCDGKYHSCPDKLLATAKRDDHPDVDPEHEDYDEWRHAMWAWRVSALALVTVSDHLVSVHMIAGNSLVKASRSYLPMNHPLRAFLKIFTYRTISINNKARLTLTMRRGIINRNWAFEEDDLQELLIATKNNFQKNFCNHLPKSMEGVKDFPANHDLKEYTKIVTELVEKMLKVIYESPGDNAHNTRLQRNMDSDPDLQAFLECLASELGLVQSSDLSSFVDVV